MTEPQTTTITPEIVRDTIQAPYRFNGDATAPEPEDEPDTATIPDGANVTSPGAEAAGTVNLGDKLGEATAKTTVAQLPIGLEELGWTASGLRSEVRTKAKLAKWPETSIRLLLDVIDGCSGDLTKIKESIRPHVAVPSED